MKNLFYLSVLLIFISCKESLDEQVNNNLNTSSLVLLGVAQDAGYPQMACKKSCCTSQFTKKEKVISLGLVDAKAKQTYLFDATPDLVSQSQLLNAMDGIDNNDLVDGIFLTHAHIGHYTGLMYLGKESMNANKLPVYTMPRLKSFLSSNGPWDQLVTNENIDLRVLADSTAIALSDELVVTPMLVPHRDEYSETVGYRIEGPSKKALFIPDIDKWQKWDRDIIAEISKVDYAFLDATFFDQAEINNRDISEIPHPFVIESMRLFDRLPSQEKNKIVFIHFNHTNPLLRINSPEAKRVLKAGYQIGKEGAVFEL